MKGFAIGLLFFVVGSCQIVFANEDWQPAPPSVQYGFQSGSFNSKSGIIPDSSNSFASSLYYDSENKLVYVTGATYWSYWDRIEHSDTLLSDLAQLDHSDCFFTILEVPGEDDPQHMKMVYTRRLGKSEYSEACSTQTFVKTNVNGGSTKIVQAGHTEEGGVMTKFRGFGTPRSSMYGFLLFFDLDVMKQEFNSPSVSEHLNGADLVNDHLVQYPVAITSDPISATNDGGVYIASLASGFDNQNSAILGEADLTGVLEPNFGKHFGVSIKKVIPKTMEDRIYEAEEVAIYQGLVEDGGLRDEMKPEWLEYFSPTKNLKTLDMENFVRISDLMYVPRAFTGGRDDRLLLTGTTTGFGSIFGDTSLNPDFDDDEPNYLVSTYLDGYMAKFSTDGKFQKTARISTGIHDVEIKGVCYDQYYDPQYIRYVFVVGETNGHLDLEMASHYLSKDEKGSISKHAFLSKIDIETLEVLWTRQLGSHYGRDVHGSGCAVAPNQELIYLAGTVKDGDSIRVDGLNITESKGGDDVFVAVYEFAEGDLRYVRQIGTSFDDWLAKGRGIVSDESGNAIILGNTKGSLMRWRDGLSLSFDGPSSDIFLMSVDKLTGYTKKISEVAGDESKVGIWMRTKNVVGHEYFAIGIASFIVFVTFTYIGVRLVWSSTSDTRSNERTLNYLKKFVDPDFELHMRNSAAGGLHGVYGRKRPISRDGQLLSTPTRAESVNNDITEIMNEARSLIARHSSDEGSPPGIRPIESSNPINSSTESLIDREVITDSLMDMTKGPKSSGLSHRKGITRPLTGMSGVSFAPSVDSFDDDQNSAYSFTNEML